MKNLFIPAGIVAFLAFTFIALNKQDRYPKPDPGSNDTYILTDQEEDENHLLREQWIEKMHRAAPGTNWRKIDRNTRWNRKDELLAKKYSRSGNYTPYANGKILAYWEERGSDNQSGRITCADADTILHKIYCAGQGGTVYRGEMDGTGWTPLNDYINLGGIGWIKSMHHNNMHRILVKSNKYFYYSDDDGMTWNEATGLNNVQSWGSIRKAGMVYDSLMNPVIVLLVQEWDYSNWNPILTLYKSTDLGTTFSKLRTFNPGSSSSRTYDIWTSVLPDPNTYLVTHDSIYHFDVFTNALTGLSAVPTGNSSYNLITGCIQPDTMVLYLYYNSDIYQSIDSGQTWAFRTNLAKSPFRNTSFVCSYSDPQTLFFGNYESWKSTDGGINWQKMNNWYDYYGDVENKLHADMPAYTIWFDTTGNENVYICTDGGIYLSDDLITTVKNLSLKGLNVSQFYTVYTNRSDTNYIYGGTQDQGFQRCTVDSGGILGFDQTISGDYGHIVSSDSGSSIWFEYPGFIAFNEDATQGVWDATADFNGINSLWIPPLLEDPYDIYNCYLAGYNNIYKATYDPITQNITFNVFATIGSADLTAMAYSPVDPTIWYVLNENGSFYYSYDQGVTWNHTALPDGPGTHWFYGATIFASKSTPGLVYIGGSGYSTPPVFVSSDSGKTFTPVTNGLPNTLVYQLEGTSDDSLVYAATEVGAYVFTVDDSTWHLLSGSQSPDQIYWTVDVVEKQHTVRFGTHGRGIWDFRYFVEDTATKSVSELVEDREFVLIPNPCNDQLSIRLGRSYVNLTFRVYNISGKLVRTFSKNTGQFIDINLGGLQNGTYILSVTGSNGLHITRRFVKLK